MSNGHARLSPSAAHRWMVCPASIRLGEKVEAEFGPEPDSAFALEGTAAHELAELQTARHTGLRTALQCEKELALWRGKYPEQDEYEMREHVLGYTTYLKEEKERYPHTQLLLERRVHPGIPECDGTADAILVSPTHIHVTDFKYGMGVPVSAENNPQIMIYGLGALEDYGDLLGDVELVRLTIYQPRLSTVSTWEISADDLRAWRDEVAIPAALLALSDDAPFVPDAAACRWCPARGRCKAQMDAALEQDFGTDPEMLSPQDMSDALGKLPYIKQWCSDLEKAALDLAYSKEVHIPGYKVVRSAGRRSITDEGAAIQTLIDLGYNAEDVASFHIRKLGVLEKLVGRKELPTALGNLLVKKEGAECLAPEDDKRPAINRNTEAVKEFTDA